MNEKNPHSFLKKPKNISFLNGGQQFDALHSGMTLSIYLTKTALHVQCMFPHAENTQNIH